ncbi:MAG: TonB-dependent receptor [Stenotrophomonas sp.]
MKQVLYRSALAVAVVTALGSGNLHAQSTPANSDAVQLDSVSVTAQRREEQMQKTPLSMSVISGVELDRMQVKRVDDVKFAAPNIVIEQNTGTSSGAKIFIRGIGTDDSMFTNDPGVALYIDDVYIPRQNGAMFDLYDVERIEVLRGPQGTLYGRNATGGAIRYISKKPTGEDKFSIDGSVGNLGRRDARVTFATRVGETLDISAAALSRQRDGFLKDITHNRLVNDQDVLAGRLSLASTWGEASYATMSIDRLRERSTPAWGTPVALDANGNQIPRLGSFYKTESDTLGMNDLDQLGVALTSETDFGAVSMRNILHYRKLHHHFYMDMDGTTQTRYHVSQDQHQNQHGYEAQFISQLEGPFSWVAGVFAFWEHNNQPTRSDVFVRGGTNTIEQDTTAYAVYAQGDYKFTDQLTLTLGGRYSHENKDFSVVSLKANGTPNFSKALQRSWNRPDWKALLSYDFADNVMGYASVTTGFKSGGFNGRGSTPETVLPVDAETLLAYELGVKSTLLDNRLRLNANYYRLDYAGIQLSAVNPQGVIVLTNATGALIQGVEVEAEAQLSRKLRVNATLGTIDSHYQDYSALNAAYFNGRALKNAPKMQWTLGASYVQPVGNADLVFSAQARHSDDYFQNQDASRLIMRRAGEEYNARIAYQPNDANWSVALWGKNLSNQFSSTGGFDIAGLGVAVLYPSVPRTYGAEFTYRFW